MWCAIAWVLAPALAPALAQNPPAIYVAPMAPTQKAQVQWPTPFDYPSLSTRYEEEGVVRLRITIAADGSVQNVWVQRTSGYRTLDRHALFRAQTAQGQAALDAKGQPMASTVEVEYVFQLEPAGESADDQRQAIDERVRRRVLRNYTEAVNAAAWLARRAAATGQAVPTSPATNPSPADLRWPTGRRAVFQAEVMPSGQMQKIALAQSSGDPRLDGLAYDALLRTRSIPLAQPIDGPITVQIELK
jgi:TonB family protein